MILFDPLDERPADLEPKGAQAWDASYLRWQVVHHSEGALAYLGLVPLDLMNRRGYWWMQALAGSPPRAVLREAKRAFALFDASLGWTTYAHTEVAKPQNSRFALFFGFRHLGTSEGQSYFER